MIITIFITYLIFFISEITSQSLILEKLIPLKFEVDNFSINENRNFIILTSSTTNEVIKINLNGTIQKKIGGFGWNDGQFDYPSSVVSTAIDIYVADYNNNRIQRFDYNLNFISSLTSSDIISFEYPVSINLSSRGDLYILDSKNKKILKINGFSRLERTFGNYESGEIVFSEPKLIKLDNLQRIYVLDKHKIIVFDQFGNFLKSIPIPNNLENEILDFQPVQNSIFLLTETEIFRFDESLTKLFIDKETINKAKFKRLEIKLDKFYLLTNRGILIFRKEN